LTSPKTISTCTFVRGRRLPGAESNRRRLVRDPQLQRLIGAHIRWLERALEDLQTDLRGTIRSSAVWRETEDLLRSVPGVGPVTAFTLIADLPELGRRNRRKIAAPSAWLPSTATAGRSAAAAW
jgi:transposase